MEEPSMSNAGASTSPDPWGIQSTEQAAEVPPVDFVSPQLTARALITGMIVGGALSICNVYIGLKIGWGLNMSITGILIAFAFWKVLSEIMGGRVRMLGQLENNVTQTACSAAGAVSSAGLVSAVPALTILDGVTLSWWQLSLWIFTVCLVGIAVAMGLRTQMIVKEKLPFPGGLSCAQTLKDIYARGDEAMRRVGMLVAGAIVASAIKVYEILAFIKRSDFGLLINGKPAATYGFAFDPTLLMLAVGGLIGTRAGISLILGAVLGWGVLGVLLVNNGLAPETYTGVRDWILWPGVTLMVVSALVSFSFSMPSILRSFRGVGGARSSEPEADSGGVTRRWFVISLGVSLVAAVVLQAWFFGIPWWAAVLAVLLSFVLAIVASRVSGETNVTPVGAMGKVTQLMFAVIMPKSAAANLMSASVTAGAASQTGDLMHDLKCGYLLGAVARKQVVGQIAGSLIGAIVASGFYLALVPDPKSMLMTTDWPAPAVANWKAVAEVFREGLDKLPVGTGWAMLAATILGVILPVMEKLGPKLGAKWMKTWTPSAPSLGLALVIPPFNSISMFIGAMIGFGLTKVFPKWSERFLITLFAGIVAGESLTGAVDAIRLVLKG
jgi:putative OPT family oligopeptide transporter